MNKNDFDITKTPFPAPSRECWLMLKGLTPDKLYMVIQAVTDYLFTGIKPSPVGNIMIDNVITKVVDTIYRKAVKGYNSIKNITDYNQQKAQQEQPVEPQEPEIDTDNFDFTPMEEEMRNVIPINPQPQPQTEETTSYRDIKRELGLNPTIEQVAEIIMRDNPTGATRSIRVNQLGKCYGIDIKDLDIKCKQVKQKIA